MLNSINMNFIPSKYFIKKGDVIFVPKGTGHSVVKKGKKALKVISVQAPFFDGKDRIFLRN
jgi:mannose-6-phosphate isomerase-like protein (cupin superfamily)